MERLPHETDGRAKRVRLLDLGKSTLLKAQKLAFDLQGNVLACLSLNESKAFLALLERVGDAAVEEALAKRPSPGDPER